MGTPLLQLRLHQLDRVPSLTALCAGYELGRWRSQELARDVFHRHLVSFAVPAAEIENMTFSEFPTEMARAARNVYMTDKYGRRGEFGELLLHAVVSDVFGGVPAISKIYFKDGANETVKGFDSVHVVSAPEQLELWLGEVKFYADVRSAISDVTEELRQHFKPDYLRGEFLAVSRKIDHRWPHAAALRALLHWVVISVARGVSRPRRAGSGAGSW